MCLGSLLLGALIQQQRVKGLGLVAWLISRLTPTVNGGLRSNLEGNRIAPTLHHSEGQCRQSLDRCGLQAAAASEHARKQAARASTQYRQLCAGCSGGRQGQPSPSARRAHLEVNLSTLRIPCIQVGSLALAHSRKQTLTWRALRNPQDHRGHKGVSLSPPGNSLLDSNRDKLFPVFQGCLSPHGLSRRQVLNITSRRFTLLRSMYPYPGCHYCANRPPLTGFQASSRTRKPHLCGGAA